MNQLGTILVIDDDHNILRLFTAVLEMAGHRARPADSGELALAAISAEAPDLILLDLSLAGMDGRAVCQAIKADPASAGIPIIFLSGSTAPDDRLSCLRLGACDFIVKPCHNEELLLRIQQHLEHRRLHLAAANQMDHLRRINQRLQAETQARRNATQALEQREELLRSMADIAHLGGWSIDLLTGAVAWTEETRRIHQAPAGFTPQTIDEGLAFYLESSRSRLRVALDQAMTTGHPFDLELDLKALDGHIIPVRVIGRPRRDGDRVTALHGTFQDVTSTRKTATIHRSQEDRFRQILEAIPHPIIITREEDGRIIALNHRYSSLVGLEPVACIGRTVIELQVLPDPGFRQHLLQRLQDEGGHGILEIPIRIADGTITAARCRVARIEAGRERQLLTIVETLVETPKAPRNDGPTTTAGLPSGAWDLGLRASQARLLAATTQEAQDLLQDLAPMLTQLRLQGRDRPVLVDGLTRLEHHLTKARSLLHDVDLQLPEEADQALIIGPFMDRLIKASAPLAREKGCSVVLDPTQVDPDPAGTISMRSAGVLVHGITYAIEHSPPAGSVVIHWSFPANTFVAEIDYDGLPSDDHSPWVTTFGNAGDQELRHEARPDGGACLIISFPLP